MKLKKLKRGMEEYDIDPGYNDLGYFEPEFVSIWVWISLIVFLAISPFIDLADSIKNLFRSK